MYESKDELPETVKKVLPEEAQDVYMEAFNASWELYDEEQAGQMSQEAVANRDAWAAVKRDFTKDEESNKWYPAGEVPEETEEEEEGGILDTLEDIV